MGRPAGTRQRSVADSVGDAGRRLRDDPRPDVARRPPGHGRGPQLWRIARIARRRLLVARRRHPRRLGTRRRAAPQRPRACWSDGRVHLAGTGRIVVALGQRAGVHREPQRARAGRRRWFQDRDRAVRRFGDQPPDQRDRAACPDSLPYAADGGRGQAVRRRFIEAFVENRHRASDEHRDEPRDDRSGRLSRQHDRVAHRTCPLRRSDSPLGCRTTDPVHRGRTATRAYQAQSENTRRRTAPYFIHGRATAPRLGTVAKSRRRLRRRDRFSTGKRAIHAPPRFDSRPTVALRRHRASSRSPSTVGTADANTGRASNAGAAPYTASL